MFDLSLYDEWFSVVLKDIIIMMIGTRTVRYVSPDGFTHIFCPDSRVLILICLLFVILNTITESQADNK